jgi:hypothetical protein
VCVRVCVYTCNSEKIIKLNGISALSQSAIRHAKITQKRTAKVELFLS